MKLFNPKTIARHINDKAPIPTKHLDVLKKWQELIKSGRIKDYKETAFHGEFKSRIVETVLGYVGPGESHEHTVSQEQAILKGAVDLALGRFEGTDGQVIAPFELKDANTDPDAIMSGRSKTPVQQAWEYATRAPGVKWVLVSNYLEVRLYGFGEGTQSYECFDLARLVEPAEYARFMLLLSAENLLSGKTAELLKESRREDKDITDALYADYKTLRGTLIYTVRQQLKELDPLDAIAAAQTVLDRVLFTAFAEDTGLLPDRILETCFEQRNEFAPQPVWENFKGLFTAINSGSKSLNVPPYNGGLFAFDPVVDQLTLPDEVCEGFKDIGAYDFASEISVTVLGHIFEQSIADVERLQAEARGEDVEPEKKSGTAGRRKRDGVVYTPDYIARFIVEQTLGTHLKEIFSAIIDKFTQKGSRADDYEAIKWKRKTAELEAWQAYRDKVKMLRIVDPACGSGVFLVMAFDYMKAELLRVNEKIKQISPKEEHFGDLLDYTPDSDILTNNLFGVDVNSESIEIAKLSLWVKTARRGKTLDSLDKNLKVGDSLIEDSSFAYLSHGFTWATAFPDVFAEGGFDIVLGNPPYVRMEFLKEMKPYLEKRFEVVSDRADLYAYFFERGLKLLKPRGRLGYISSATFFKTGSGRPLRDFLRTQATIETVVDFGDLQIFEGVTTYPAILTMNREAPSNSHMIRFWNIETLPEANFRATFEKTADEYPQSALSSGSWELESPALKTLRDKIRNDKRKLKEVYGSPLYGIKTGLNEAFVIDTPTKNQLCAQDPDSTNLIKPFLEGRDFKTWRADPRIIKQAFQDCWAISDSRAAFASALEERGYYLAKGERRGFVAVDWRGEVYPISRWVGTKTKEVKSKLGNLENLPSVEITKRKFAAQFTDKLRHFADDAFATHEKAEQGINARRQSLAENHRHHRAQLKQSHATRWIQEAKTRSSLLPTGLKALWFRVTGKYKQIKKLNEAETLQCKSRDQSERQMLIDRQLRERRKIQHDIRLLRHQHGIRIKKLNRDIGSYLKLSPDSQVDALNRATSENTVRRRRKQRSRDFS